MIKRPMGRSRRPEEVFMVVRPELSDLAWELLGEAATTYHFSSIDLRYEGGSYVAQLEELAALGLLARTEGSAAYMLSFTITEAGRARWAAGRQGVAGT
jgi:hypothetical protein